ncbi:hypothetical protein GPA10_22480 [Streptomyces sp. p1417]|uniref:Uncharacterized protein n=1 Tax=Streptomyces typhae TaxID=2681492 RepID=A0A6L6X0Z9_9ACTN|nr:hypothetical protein [Streptomyces typhae]MVO87453.1 hypothetical protein [Streptomyces typhae]
MMPRKENPESKPYAYPLAIRGGNYGFNSLHVWESKEGGEQYKLDWFERERSVIRVSRMTDPGSYWFNNWGNSRHGTPSTWEEIDVIDFGDTELRLMFNIMEAYAVKKFGVVDVRPL